MKRVACLYRVSTTGQVEKDDIPLQKTSCREFSAKQDDWVIVKELYEKGVSGFKTSAKDRDAIVELQKMAIEDEFDILLVFMFDRIGRKEDETPFIVEWFVRHGIEVWSVNEGEQRFDHHVDKLLNFIRYWQASGESIKTSIRTSARMEQIVKEGRFKGGNAPFGYRLVHKGRLNKKGQPVYDLEIDEYETTTVRHIFDLYVNHGLGTQTIARRLAEEGVLTRKGASFTSPTIKNMIKNPAYRGILRSGKGVSEPFEHLRIIDDETFFKAQEIAEQRSAKYQEGRRIPRKVAKECLLTGNIFCGHCGARLITSTSGGKRKRKDGSIYVKRFWRYICYNQMRHRELCDGQSGYSAKRVDKGVSEAVRRLLGMLKKASIEDMLQQQYTDEIKAREARSAKLQIILRTKKQELHTLKSEVVKAIEGSSSFAPDLLNEMIEATQDEIDEATRTLDSLMEESKSIKTNKAHILEVHDKLIGFDEMFDACNQDQQRMIICQLIDQVRVKRGYEIELRLNVSLNQYLAEIDSSLVDDDTYCVSIAGSKKINASGLTVDMSLHEAIFHLQDANPGLEWEDAMEFLEIKN